MKLKEISSEGKLYAFVCSLNEVKEGLEFLSDDSDFIQLGTWNYKKHFSTVPHYHLEHDKPSNLTQEVVLVHKGSVKCRLYTKEGKFVEEVDINEGELIVQIYGVHEYIMNKDSIVLEIKNGPYFGPEVDRKRIDIIDKPS
ncbi:MAG: hypothetical protein CBC04_00665 [Verrucomicrobia bacterium TMED44]|nr:MAG: hypothetical protein CBC04_00665 [Verrucomicrobia bacterium TMED44]|tara:strand:+ start:179 stop:601 length:423 start_codon:yes stop_codon:yes gene_type:complete